MESMKKVCVPAKIAPVKPPKEIQTETAPRRAMQAISINQRDS
jgi:hypothetical protein